MPERDRKSKIKRSYEKYHSYDPNVWSLEFFDSKTGGYVVVNRKRLTNAGKSGGELEKYNDEFSIAKVFAIGGHYVEMLEEIPCISSPDVMFDGIPADLKYTSNAKNIVSYAEKAVRKQGSRIVLFKIQKKTARAQLEFKTLTNRKIHGMYFVSGSTQIYTF